MSAERVRPAAPRTRGWMWFFVAVSTLTVLAVVIIVWFGQQQLRQQVTREQLNDARKLWEEHGPSDYRLRYTNTFAGAKSEGEAQIDTYVVVVHNRKVVSVTRNDRPLALREDQHVDHDMPALFKFIDDFLQLDAKADRPRTFARAEFDVQDGHLKQYRRKVLSGRERQEIVVEELTRLPK